MTDVKTMIFSPPGLEDSDFQKRIPILTFVAGSDVGRRLLLADDSITLGRAQDSTIMIKDPAVSRFHVKIEYDPQANVYLVNDLGSSNGTLLNAQKITTSVLTEGDKITMGRTVLRFSWIDNIDMVFHGEVDKLINIDQLTGLVVKRRFDEELNRHVAVALRNETPLSMLMMDMDGLKRINDTFGHPFGAHSISDTGKIIKTVISPKGLAARFGGDEFMAFLPNTPINDAKDIAEEIRSTVEHHNYEKDNTPFRLSISIGVAELKKKDTPEMLLKRADDALYISKKQGRNKVSVMET